MKLIVAGGRDYKDWKTLIYCLNRVHDTQTITEIVSGCATGADKLGEEYAALFEIPIQHFPADWSLGKKAGPLRNEEMAKYADAVALFPGGIGTENMYKMAVKYKLKIFDYRKV